MHVRVPVDLPNALITAPSIGLFSFKDINFKTTTVKKRPAAGRKIINLFFSISPDIHSVTLFLYIASRQPIIKASALWKIVPSAFCASWPFQKLIPLIIGMIKIITQAIFTRYGFKNRKINGHSK